MDIQRFAAHIAQLKQDSRSHDERQPSQDESHTIGRLTSQPTVALESTAVAVAVPVTPLSERSVTQLLNVAVGHLAPEEVYCEIGCLPGANLTAALLNHPDCRAYAVAAGESVDAQPGAIDAFAEKLERNGLEEQVCFCCQSFEEFFHDLKQMASGDRLGVYFYNDQPDYRSVLLGLMLAAPLLSEEALILIGQAELGTVRQAAWDFLVAYPQAQLLFDTAVLNSERAVSDRGLIALGWNVMQPQTEAFDWQQHRDRAVINAIYHLPVHANHFDPELDLEAVHKEAVELHVEGRLAEAEQKYRTILQVNPQNATIWLNLGMLYHLAENDQAAIDVLQRSIDLKPTDALAYNIRGLSLERLTRVAEAKSAYEQAITLKPDDDDTLNRLGNLYVQSGALSEAEALFRRAIAAKPDNFMGHLNLGDVLVAQGQHVAAIDAFKTALAHKKRDPDLLQKIGTAYQALDDHISAHNYFAYAHYRGSDHEAAIQEFQQFFALSEPSNGSNSDIGDYLTLYDCYHHCSELQLALQCLEKMAELRPDDQFLQCFAQLALPPLYQTAEEIFAYRQQITQSLKLLVELVTTTALKGEAINIELIQCFTNFYLAYQGENDRDIQAMYGQLRQMQMGVLYPEWQQPRVMPPVRPTGKIRIGYLANNIGNNSDTRWALGWLKNHDRSQFEVYCYNIGADSDPRTEQFKTLSDAFHHFPDNLEATAKQIIADDLHILIFLAIGTWAATANIASLRLAPVQCSAWGHPVTSGIATVDYFLSGDLMEPDNAQMHYTEELIRLPNLGFSYPAPVMPEPSHTRADFGLRDDAVLYLSCQMLFKYLPQYDFLFVEIVRRVPNAQLVFVLRSTVMQGSNASLDQQFRQRLERAFAAAGLKSDDYCVFLQGQDGYRYTSLLAVVDVCLDTLGFSGGHTTFDAIARRLPVVTCPGKVMRGRQSYGALKMLGVTDTIAQTEAEYIDIAVRLGLEPEWRQSLAQRMGERQRYLFDDLECVKGLEQFYQQAVAAKLAEQADSVTTPTGTLAAQTPPIAKAVLHVGSGPYNPYALPESLRPPTWREVRLDINPAVNPDVIGSITDMNAVLDESVDAVFSSHNLEHIYAHEVPIALAEFYRVLKPGGFALITLPDIQAVAAYVAEGKLEETLYVSPAGPIAAIDILYGLRTAIAEGNHFMAHRMAFTAETLQQKLEQQGFREIESHKDGLNLWARGYK